MTEVELARSTETSSDTLMSLVYNWDWGVRYFLAGNLKTPPTGLDVLAYDEKSLVRHVVALHPYVSLETLFVLIGDRDDDVRRAAAHHPNAPPAAKLWAFSEYRNSMSLKEFLETVQ